MKEMRCLLALLLVCVLSVQAQRNRNNQNDNRGRYNPYYNDPYYSNRYYKNREYYNNRQYYDNVLKRYNPEVAAPQARIVDQDVETNHDGNYMYKYETENGIQMEERGVAVKSGTEEQKEVVEGSYSFITPEGIRVIVRYTADENGFHPTISYDGPNTDHLVAAQQPADVVINRINK